LSIEKLKSLGWNPEYNSKIAVKRTVYNLLGDI